MFCTFSDATADDDPAIAGALPRLANLALQSILAGTCPSSHSPRRPPILRHVRRCSAMWTGHRLGSALVRHLHRRARWRPRNRECTCRLTRTAINSFSLNSVGSCPLVICTPRCHTSRHASQRQLGLLLLAHRLPLRTTPQSGRPKRRCPYGRQIIMWARLRALSPRLTRESCIRCPRGWRR